jgi:hypothetical protein
MSTNHDHRNRSGSVAVFALCLMIAMLVIVALAVDIGYLSCVDAELQRTADAAAIAAAWRLVEQERSGSAVNSDALTAIATAANQYAALNKVANAGVTLAASDTDVGEIAYPFSSTSTMNYGNPSRFNAVKVRVRKTSDPDGNGPAPLFFARIMGYDSCDMQRQATAAFVNNFNGFRAPSDGTNLQMLPFALDQQTWDDLLAGVTADNYRWDPDANCVRNGPDGVREANLYPQGTGSPGNRGTVDIGSSNNSTNDICRQIRNGISQSDLAALGGKIEFDASGKLYLNGDTGISAGVKDDLASILGQTRIIPVFTQVTGPGNNAQYTIVRFIGARIMYVNLTGSASNKQVIIQPASVVSRGAIPASGTTPASQFIYSPVWLVH